MSAADQVVGQTRLHDSLQHADADRADLERVPGKPRSESLGEVRVARAGTTPAAAQVRRADGAARRTTLLREPESSHWTSSMASSTGADRASVLSTPSTAMPTTRSPAGAIGASDCNIAAADCRLLDRWQLGRDSAVDAVKHISESGERPCNVGFAAPARRVRRRCRCAPTRPHPTRSPSFRCRPGLRVPMTRARRTGGRRIVRRRRVRVHGRCHRDGRGGHHASSPAGAARGRLPGSPYARHTDGLAPIRRPQLLRDGLAYRGDCLIEILVERDRRGIVHTGRGRDPALLHGGDDTGRHHRDTHNPVCDDEI